jgi:threonine 3-dehydrogenase
LYLLGWDVPDDRTVVRLPESLTRGCWASIPPKAPGLLCPREDDRRSIADRTKGPFLIAAASRAAAHSEVPRFGNHRLRTAARGAEGTIAPVKAIVKSVAGAGAVLREVPVPQAPRDGVLVRVQSVSLCGTDLHVFNWDSWSAGRVRPPIVMGHEWAGEVVECGPDVQGLSVGDFVSGESHAICGHCRQCRTGQGHVCRNTRIFGVDTDGCFAEFFAVPQASVLRNDPTVPAHVACIQDPLGNAVHAVQVGEIAGMSVAVLGCGPIGQFAVAVCRALGSGRIIATDVSPYRRALATQLGADLVLDPLSDDIDAIVTRETNGEGIDVVLEMSGAVPAVRQALRLARPGGRVSLMGIPSAPVELDIAEDVIFKGLTLHGVVGRRLYGTWITMQNLLATGRLDIAPILTHRLPFGDFEEGFRLMQSGQCGKVVLDIA